VRSQSIRQDAEQDWDEAGDSDHPSRSGAALWRKLASNPKEAVAVSLSLAAAAMVIVNALFLQSGPHPAPIFSTRIAAPPASDATGSVAAVIPRPRPADAESARTDPQPAARPPAHAAAAAPHDDPIALLLAPSKRVLEVQRALAAYGYGQITPTGIEDRATAAAIRKFERDRKLPVNGQVSNRFVHELSIVTGRSFD
jgi:hypothetical protein